MLVSKSVRSSTVVALLALGVAACSESPTGPVGMSAGAEPLMAKGGNGYDNGSSLRKVSSRTFTIRPGKPVIENFDDHSLKMPADAVCDPAMSGYGAGYWDLPCSPITSPIQVTAYWTKYKGDPLIRFQPDLRFAPSNDKDRWVVLTVAHAKDADPDKSYSILWRDPVTDKWIDESLEDASQVTQTKKNLRAISRRLKHFSDYFLWSGFGSYNVTSGLEGDLFGLGGW